MNNNSLSAKKEGAVWAIWPIKWHEHKKFLPMALMMFCILLNYSVLRSIKDSFVVNYIASEAIPFLKLGVVPPAAIIAMIIYVKLCDVLKRENVFYTIIASFIVYFALFILVLHPYRDFIHPSHETIDALSKAYPRLQWPIKAIGQWSAVTLYAMAELWGSMVLSLLFWQFANYITQTEEAKRFYSMFGMLGNLGLITAGVSLKYLTNEGLMFVIISSCVVIMMTYGWMNKHVLTDPTLYKPSNTGAKKSKVKLSLTESFKVIFTSKYLGLIAMLVIGYGMSVNLVEGVWKSKMGALHNSTEEYNRYMGKFQIWQGAITMLCMLVGSNILRVLPWFTAAIVTPIITLVTGVIFFTFISFDTHIAAYLGLSASGLLVAAVIVGTVQNVLTKAVKYSLFDATKNMTYIPLDENLRTKGQAAVDVVGGRLGKSGGAALQSALLVLFTCFDRIVPYCAGVFLVVVVLWIYAVKALNKEYKKKING